MGYMKQFSGSAGRLGGGSHRSFLEVDWFFDKPAVMSAVDRASRRVLSKFGAFVRRTARQSIRKPRRKPVGELTDSERLRYKKTGYRPFAPSKPGEPPRNQTGKLRDNILFWYDRHEHSVTIGASAFNSKDIPGVLEHGGSTRLPGGRVVNIEARPFIGPAYDKEEPKLESLWRDSVR